MQSALSAHSWPRPQPVEQIPPQSTPISPASLTWLVHCSGNKDVSTVIPSLSLALLQRFAPFFASTLKKYLWELLRLRPVIVNSGEESWALDIGESLVTAELL